jgi:hypothetical protein
MSHEPATIFAARPRSLSRAAADEFLQKVVLIQARSIAMMDAVMLAIGSVFFALSIGYVYGCDRL